jgi:hypothetical protein
MAAMTTWQVDVFDNTTDALVAEIPARRPDRSAARAWWGIDTSERVDGLLIRAEHLAFVNELLDAPLELRKDRSAYLCEFAEYIRETVDY